MTDHLTQTSAPAFTTALIGHPANRVAIVKTDGGYWRYVHNGSVVDDENFRVGWWLITNPEEVLVVERVNKITGTRELLHVVSDIEVAASLTYQHIDGWARGSDRVWETETPAQGVVITATPRPVRHA